MGNVPLENRVRFEGSSAAEISSRISFDMAYQLGLRSVRPVHFAIDIRGWPPREEDVVAHRAVARSPRCARAGQ